MSGSSGTPAPDGRKLRAGSHLPVVNCPLGQIMNIRISIRVCACARECGLG